MDVIFTFLIFLWLLSFHQGKESDNTALERLRIIKSRNNLATWIMKQFTKIKKRHMTKI